MRVFRQIVVVGLSAIAGCSFFEWRSPVMAPDPHAQIEAAAPSDLARVVFLQSSADDYPNRAIVRVADEGGRVLGDSLPSTWFAVVLPAGDHELFGWETNREIAGTPSSCECLLDHCYFVAAMRAHLLPGRTYYVRIGVEEHSTAGILADETVDFARLSPHLETWPSNVRERLRPLATSTVQAEAITRRAATSYETSFLCIGRARMRDASQWDASKSVLHPGDGVERPPPP